MIFCFIRFVLQLYQRKSQYKCNQVIKSQLLALILKRQMGQSISNQTHIFENAQSFYDDATDLQTVISSFLDSIYEPIAGLIVRQKKKAYFSLYAIPIFVPLPFVSYMLLKIQKEVKKQKKEFKKAKNSNQSQIGLIAQRNQMAKSYNMLDYEITRLYEKIDKQGEQRDVVLKLRQQLANIKKYLNYYIQFVGILVAIRLIYIKRFKISQAKQFLDFCDVVYNEFTRLFEYIGNFSEQLHVIEQVCKSLEVQQEDDQLNSVSKVVQWLQQIQRGKYNMKHSCEKSNSISIQFKDVSFSHTGAKLIEHFSQDFESQYTYALVGKTGCGKSTLASLLINLFHPQQGSILVQDTDVKEYDLFELRNLITISQQSNPVIEEDTLRNNISYGLDLSDEKLLYFMSLCCIDFAKLDEQVSQLSGGEAQRVALARALARESKIIVLDECTAALDLETEKIVLSNIIQHFKQKGILAIFIAHREAVLKAVDKQVLISKLESEKEEGNTQYIPEVKVIPEEKEIESKENRKALKRQKNKIE